MDRLSLQETTSCVVLDGGVKCWGNLRYALGVAAQRSPTAIAGFPPPVREIAPGFGPLCALTAAGGVWCVGRNSYGELGIGQASSTDVRVPAPVRP